MANSLDCRWDAVRKLQQRLYCLQPGSEVAEIVEHAISLAINSKSQELNYKFFYYDTIRNARFSVLRTKIRQRRLLKKAACLADRWAESPETYTLSNLETELREIIAQSDENLAICFDAMISGESVSATAVACGVSQRTVDRLRCKVRQIVQSYLNSQKAI